MLSQFDIEMATKSLGFSDSKKCKDDLDTIENKSFTITSKDILNIDGEVLTDAVAINPMLALFGDEICTIIAIMAFKLKEKGEK